MFIFSEEKKKKLRKKNPDMPESELTRLLVRLWGELSEKKKVTCFVLFTFIGNGLLNNLRL